MAAFYPGAPPEEIQRRQQEHEAFIAQSRGEVVLRRDELLRELDEAQRYLQDVSGRDYRFTPLRSAVDNAIAGGFTGVVDTGRGIASLPGLVSGLFGGPDPAEAIYPLFEGARELVEDTFPGDPARDDEFLQQVASAGGYWGPSLAAGVLGAPRRLLYVGRNPDKYSSVGQRVVERMRSQGLIEGEGPLLRGNPNNLMLVTAGGRVRIDETIDMSHIEAAVTWWNREGMNLGPLSVQAREFQLDPDNYILELRSPNRSRGASSGERKLVTILPSEVCLIGR